MKPRVKLPDNFSETVAETAGKLNIVTSQGRAVLAAAMETAMLCDSKQLDYGPTNIKAFGEQGVIVRVNDKFERLKTLYSNKRRPKNEPIDDSWFDLADYALIAITLRRGQW
jgi:hypothetical protein